MCGYFCIGFIDFMLAGKTLTEYTRFIDFMLAGKLLTEYTNLSSPNNFKENNDIILNYFYEQYLK